MTTLLAAIAVLTPQSTSFFPLDAGQTWEYLVSVAGSVVRVRQIQKTLPIETYDGAPTTPLQIFLEGKIDSTGYYRVVNGFYCLVGQSGSNALAEPIKLIPVAPKKGMKWEFTGQQMMLGMMLSAKIESKIVADEEKEVFGSKVRCVTVETKSTMGEGDRAFLSETTEVYGEGIGLITKRQESRTGKKTKNTTVTVTTLMKYEKGS
jgi:hypothetical protein